MVREKAQSGYMGCVVVLALIGIAYALLAPVFLSARASARTEKAMESGKRLGLAARLYADRHQGHLPTGDWKATLAQIDPKLKEPLQRIAAEWHTGFAAVPGTQGKTLTDLDAATVLYAQYRSAWDIQTIEDVGDLGDPYRNGSVVVITARDLLSAPMSRMANSCEIAYQLGHQGAFLKNSLAK